MTTASRLPMTERLAEEVLGNRLGAGVYRDWVASLGLRGDESVLDVGTGAGACARHLADALPDGHLTCLDSDGRWLDVARGRLRTRGNVEFVEADAARWSRAGAYDAAVLHFVLHDVSANDRPMVVANVASSLRREGRVFLREPVDHGLSAEQMRDLLWHAGFVRLSEREGTVPLMGPTTSMVWEKQA
jgi:ubiquinone/menaquinone biosynthesis C-methylase UbiE